MKFFALALLAFSFATPSFAAADETMTVSAPRVPGDSSPSAFPGGGARPGRPGLERPKLEASEGGGTPLTNAKLAELAITQIGSLVTTLRDAQAYASLQVIVQTPEGLRVEVNLDLGFGKVDVKSRRIVGR